MKRTLFSLFVVATVTIILVSGCGDMNSDAGDHTGRFCLSSVYADDTMSQIRFNTHKQKDEIEQAYEKISEQWNLDFLRAAE